MTDRTLIRNPNLAAAYAAIQRAEQELQSIPAMPDLGIESALSTAASSLEIAKLRIEKADAQIQKAKEGEGS